MLNLEFAHSGSGFQPMVENLPKGRHGSGGFFGGFLQWIFWSQNAKEKSAKKSAAKSASRKQKVRRRTTPPKSTSQAQKSTAKPTSKSICQTSRYTPGFFRLRRLALGGVSEHGFWDTLWLPSWHGRGSQAEMHLQSLSCCWWEGQVCCTPFQTTPLVKNVRFEKTAQK